MKWHLCVGSLKVDFNSCALSHWDHLPEAGLERGGFFFLPTYFGRHKGSSVILIPGHKRIIEEAHCFENVLSVLLTGAVSSAIQRKVTYIHRISPLGESPRRDSHCLLQPPATTACYELDEKGVAAAWLLHGCCVAAEAVVNLPAAAGLSRCHQTSKSAFL